MKNGESVYLNHKTGFFGNQTKSSKGNHDIFVEVKILDLKRSHAFIAGLWKLQNYNKTPWWMWKKVAKGDWLRDYTWILYPEIRLWPTTHAEAWRVMDETAPALRLHLNTRGRSQPGRIHIHGQPRSILDGKLSFGIWFPTATCSIKDFPMRKCFIKGYR